MKLKLVAAISALGISALAHAQQGQPTVPKPTKADAQKVVQIITRDKVKTQAYCDLTKLEGQVKAVQPTTDPKTVEMLTKQLSQVLPGVVNGLTPNGRLPTVAELSKMMEKQ